MDDNKQLDCQGAWLMVREDLTGKLANHEDLKYGGLCRCALFLAIVYSAFLHDAFRNLRIPSPLSMPSL